MITTEPNHQRKAHRVDVPLYIQIGDKTYASTDWSVTGMGIQTEGASFERDAEFPARLMLPMKDAQMNLDVKVAVRRIGESGVGLEFVDMEPAVRRILRHYLQLHIDGKLDSAEDLVALANVPTVDTPLNEAINMSETQQMLARKFKHRGLLTATIILLFFLVFAGVLFYNRIYSYQATGVVFGNVDRVTANYGGILEHVDAKVGSYVKKDARLFDLLNTGSQALLHMGGGRGTRTIEGSAQAEQALLDTLHQAMLSDGQSNSNAGRLYRMHLITRKDYVTAKNDYLASRTAYLRQKALVDGTYEITSGNGSGGGVMNPVIRARHAGQVIAVSAKPGTYVGESQVVVMLQRNDVVPKVAIPVPNAEALDLHVDMPAEVYVPFQNRRYKAHIAAIGGATINPAITDSVAASMQDTLVTLTFDDPSVRIPFGSRVHAWIKTF